jgi:CHAT domain-containing protein
MYLNHLGVGQRARFRSLGELTNLQDSISNLDNAVQLTDDAHPNKAMYLSELGISRRARFGQLGEVADLENSNANYEKAVQLTDDAHPHKVIYLANLGTGQWSRYNRFGRLADLEALISNYEKAVQLSEDGHPYRAGYLSDLGIGQSARFERFGKLSDLDDSISNLEKSVRLIDGRHPNKALYLNNLGVGKRTRFEQLGDLTDLEDSISAHLKSLQLTSDGNPNKAMYLADLGISQYSRFERLGEFANLEESTSNLDQAVQLTDDTHPNKAEYLSNLADSHSSRFHRLGELKYLDSSISHYMKALQLTDDAHPKHAKYLGSLGNSQRDCFDRLGKLTDLESSISNLRRAAELMDDGNPYKTTYLFNLAIGQGSRFSRFGELSDLESSISNYRMSAQLIDDAHPNKAICLCNLGIGHLKRFNRLGELTDLRESISHMEKTIQLTDDTYPHRASYLANLGMGQLQRFKQFGELTDLEDSICNLGQSVQLTSDGHTNQAAYFSMLGRGQHVRFEHLGELTSLENCIASYTKSVQLTDDTDPVKAKYLDHLGICQRIRSEHLNDAAGLLAAVSVFQTAVQLKSAYPIDTFRAAQHWAEITHRNGDFLSALKGYHAALEILPKVAWLGLSTASRQSWLIEGESENLSCLAATCAIQRGHLEEAAELLDLGRSVFWQQASSLRSDLEKLREEEPELAKQLADIGQRLDAGNFSDSLLDVKHGTVAMNAEDIGQERRHLVGEWEGLLDRVRQLPRFEHFLKPVPFSQLRQAATGGQVIIINASKYSVDALIFDDTHPVVHVPLPQTNIESLTDLAHNIVLHRPQTASSSQRRRYNKRYLKPALRKVWNSIIVPIFNQVGIQLNGKSDSPQHHIWWYPTGPLTFIPLHAAGPGEAEIDVSRLVISSYVTTLSSLFRMQKDIVQGVVGQQKFLAVSQPDTPGQEPLPLASKEVDTVMQVVTSTGWQKRDIVCLSGSDATVDCVLRELGSSCWVHLACHGMQHPTSGMKSAFALHHGMLELDKIASKKLSAGRFAFLSACHTAAGLQRLPGEAMHLAGGLQFAGFSSVVATMWYIKDEDALIVAEHTYRYLFRNGQGCDPSEAAAALNHAVLHLRKDPSVTVDRWAPFIHFGI